DRKRCDRWGISVADVESVIKTAVGGQAFTQMTEGEKTFDITLRWPERLRASESTILETPVDITNNMVTPGSVPSIPPTPLTGQSTGLSSLGTAAALPSPFGSGSSANLNPISSAPRRPLKDLVVPINDHGQPDPGGQFLRPGASTIYREQGKRLIAIKFSV